MNAGSELLEKPKATIGPDLAEGSEGRHVANQWIHFLFCGAVFVLPFGTSPFSILAICALAVWIFSGEFVRSRNGYLKSTWFLPVLSVTVLTWAGLLWSTDPTGQGIRFATKTHYWLYAFAIASVRFSGRRAEHLVLAFLGGLLTNTLAAYLQLAGIFPRFAKWGGSGYTGFNSGYNTLGILLVLGMMAASFGFNHAVKRRDKLLFCAMLILFFGHLLMLEGRGAYLSFLVLMPVVLHNLFPARRLSLVVVAYALTIAVMAASPVVRHRVGQAIADLNPHLNSEGPAAWGKKYSEHLDRIYMWRLAAELFIEHPLGGVGTGGLRQAGLLRGSEKAIDHPHSNLLHVAASYGVVGLLVFTWLFYSILRVAWQKRMESAGFFVLSSALVILVGGLTDTHILDAGGAFLLAVSTGLQSAFGEVKTE